MARPERIETLEDVKIWIADHNGRIDAFWAHQHAWNEGVKKQLVSGERRLTALEKKVMYFSGAAAALGSVVGALLAKALITL